ncbi:hypothetical protein V2J09_002696 [Rumex salicifolius]
MASSKLKALWNNPAGPKTIHFWAPAFKWGLIIANIADFQKPPEQVSYPIQAALAVSGTIWSRYSTLIKPRNPLLLSVNMATAATGCCQIIRKLRHDYVQEKESRIAE